MKRWGQLRNFPYKVPLLYAPSPFVLNPSGRVATIIGGDRSGFASAICVKRDESFGNSYSIRQNFPRANQCLGQFRVCLARCFGNGGLDRGRTENVNDQTGQCRCKESRAFTLVIVCGRIRDVILAASFTVRQSKTILARPCEAGETATAKQSLAWQRILSPSLSRLHFRTNSDTRTA